MNRLSSIRSRYGHLPPQRKTALTIIAASAIVFAFTVGAGAAAVVQANITHDNTAPIVIQSDDSVKTPATLKVEILRNGNTICQGVNTPAVDHSDYSMKYIIERPIVDCPPLRIGDTVRATWIQSSEVNISFKED